MNATGPGGGTPTAQAITAALSSVQSTTLPDGPTVFLLATDGEPTGCDTTSENSDRDDTIASIESAAAAGYPTYVIGVGISSGNLTLFAQAGRPNDPNADYYPASNANALSDALRSIITDQITCTVEVQGQVDVNKAHLGTVKLNDNTLDYDNATRGWRILPGGTELELLGTACDEWSSGDDASLTANFPCGVVLE
ncbi:MAG: hypothetical protein R3A47_10590 [Polyangiales bacterium]